MKVCTQKLQIAVSYYAVNLDILTYFQPIE